MAPLRELRPAISIILLFTLALGLALPLGFTGAMQLAFPFQANGSLLRQHGAVIGSTLIGQNFTGAAYFTSRPSALSPAYNAAQSGASNLAPSSAALLAQLRPRIAAYRKAYGPGPVPADAVTASGSGLDPDISLADALRQVPAVAAARHLPVAGVDALVRHLARYPAFGFIGTDHVNVLELNLALEHLEAR